MKPTEKPTAQPTQLLVDGRPVAAVELADTVLTRARGLLFRRDLPEALLLRPCSSVHGAWMRVPLDVALLTADLEVVHAQVLRPWAATRPRRGVTQVLEAPTGSFERWGLRPGSRVALAQA
ncbi:DUF192 domain-containing protein [Promicromonospora sukumoe]